MNCMQGDLAYVRGSATGIDGVIVRCVAPTTHSWSGIPAWLIEPRIPAPGLPGWEFDALIDDILHPIRGLPETETVDEEVPCRA